MPLRRLLRSSWRSRPVLVRCGATALIVLVAFGVRMVLWGASSALPFITFFPAVVLVSTLCGPRAAWAAVLASAMLGLYYFVEPIRSLALTRDSTLAVALFVLVSGFLVLTVTSLQEAVAQNEEGQKRLLDALAVAEKERRTAEAKERDLNLLMIEFGHRVKNDLARISAMLRMQSADASPETKVALRAAADRVLVLSRIHDRLARHEGHVLVDVETLLEDLVADIHKTASMKPIGLFVNAESYMLPASRAGAVGLVANELLTNALKHAFPNDQAGAVNITFRQDGDSLLLVVADDGVGIPGDEPEMRKSRGGMGSRLTRALAAQLGGRIQTMPTAGTGGTTHMVRFPITPTGSSASI